MWGWFRDGARGAVGVIPFRNGHMERPRAQVMKTMVTPCAELLGSMMIQHYGQGTPVPSEILLPFSPEPMRELQEILSEHRGRSVLLHVPARGKKQQLVGLALENTRQHYLSKTNAEERHQKALEDLASLLHLPSPPHRMECFDNSNLGGQHPVAAMAVFLDGRPSRKHYRRYRIKTVTGSDDYASMREVLSRRLKRGLADDLLPNLVIVDGGPGQIGRAHV